MDRSTDESHLSQMVDELRDVLRRIDASEANGLLEAIGSARRIFTYGVGREGLVLRSFCMRLMHLGLDAHVVGDMTTPPLEQGDLLVVSAGPGYFASVAAFAGVARSNGGKVAALTAHPEGEIARGADLALIIPAQTLVTGSHEVRSVQFGGSLYEQAMWLYLDYLVLKLKDKRGQTFEDMAKRHTNME